MFEKAKKFVSDHQKAFITVGMILVGSVVGVIIVGAAINEQEANNQLIDSLESGQIQPNDDPNDQNVYATWPDGEKEVIG